jgi:2-C-methyl-D-erythritol 2,4-cyclodiphosphate synthase
MRVGIGYDIHVLKKGRKLILGGVRVPHTKGLGGHSDGDVLLHAIVDAVLGAMGGGDIGDHFSDKDSRTQGANSLVFVKKIRVL